MGSSATFCYCKNLREFMPFGKVLEKRTALFGVMKEYLAEIGCVSGTPKNVDGINPYADALGTYYIALLKSELSGHGGNEVESLASMKGLSIVFSEMWAEASRILESNNDIAAFDLSLLPLATRREPALEMSRIKTVVDRIENERNIPPELKFSYEYGELLVKSYSKALVELNLCASGSDKAVIKHHCALLGDLLDEMLDLVQYPYDHNPPSEHSLPAAHPHALTHKVA